MIPIIIIIVIYYRRQYLRPAQRHQHQTRWQSHKCLLSLLSDQQSQKHQLQ